MIKKLKDKYLSHEGALFRYSLSYCLLLALFPTIMMFFLFYYDLSYVVSFLYQFIPEEFMSGYLEYLMNYPNEDFFSLLMTFLLANYVASKVFYSFMILSMKDENYHLSLIIVRMKSFFAYLFFILCLLGIFVLFQMFQLSSLTFVLLFIVFYLFYRILSFERKKWTYGIAGGIIVSLFLMMMGYMFSWYITYFTSYKKLYGSFGVLFVVYLSMYFISSIVYFGYCLNIVMERKNRYVTYKYEKLYRKIEKMIDHFHF